MNKKSFFLIFIAALSIVTFWNLTSSISRRAKADVTVSLHQIDVTVSPPTVQMNTGDTQIVTFNLKPSAATDRINAMYLQINSAGLQIVDVSRPTTSNGGTILYTEYVRTFQNGKIQLAYDFTTSSTTSTIIPPQTVMFTVTVKKVADSGSCALQLDDAGSAVYYGYDPATYYSAEFTWGQTNTFACLTTPTATSGPTPTTGPTLTPTPNPSIVLSNVPTNIPNGICEELPPPQNLNPSGTIYVTAEGQRISWDPVAGAVFYGVEIWEQSKVQPTGTTGIAYSKIFTSSTTDTFYIYKNFTQDKNYIIKVSAVDACNNAWTQAQRYILVSGAAPTLTPTAVPYPTATPTVSIPLVTIKMRIRLQGIYSKPTRTPKTAQVFLVWVRNADRENPIYKWVTATYDQIGSWFIEDTWNLVPGDGYKVWIKGEKHLQRKICDGKPSDQESGFYHCGDDNGQIVIRPGDNVLDFSNVMMFAGDLPFKGEGDGVLDAFDLAFIATHFDEKTDDIGDLNYDGVTDSQDYGIAVNAIRIQKYDETYPYKIHPFFRNVPLHPQFP